MIEVDVQSQQGTQWDILRWSSRCAWVLVQQGQEPKGVNQIDHWSLSDEMCQEWESRVGTSLSMKGL